MSYWRDLIAYIARKVPNITVLEELPKEETSSSEESCRGWVRSRSIERNYKRKRELMQELNPRYKGLMVQRTLSRNQTYQANRHDRRLGSDTRSYWTVLRNSRQKQVRFQEP